VWQGFLMPDTLHGEPCDRCNGGETWASRWLYLLCYRINMLAGDVRDQERGRPMHPYLANDQAPPIVWRPDPERKRPFISDDYDVMRPSADIIDLIAGIAGCEPDRVGGLFGGNTEYDLYKAVVKASGLESWGSCEHCQGRGEHERYEGQRVEAEAWERSEPPTGEGWQLWETVSEGSPVSPVFPTAESLAQWLTTKAGGEKAGPSGRPLSIEAARGFVGAGWAPTGVIDAQGVHDGAEFRGFQVGWFWSVRRYPPMSAEITAEIQALANLIDEQTTDAGSGLSGHGVESGAE
jgi:hypothetical protein